MRQPFEGIDDSTRSIPLRFLRIRDPTRLWNPISGYPQAVNEAVPGYVVRYQSEKRSRYDELQQELGLGSDETAWTWLHTLRRAMVRPGSGRLSGSVAIDAAYWGSEEAGMMGCQTEADALIAVAVESTEGKMGRLRLERIPDASRKSRHGLIAEGIEPNGVIDTDGWAA
jgi:hypothetical protein